MRTSNDIYKLPNGSFLSISQSILPPEEATIYTGYDYTKQEWIYQGKKDIRTLKELKKIKN